jgi:phosphoribosylamine-glycine ligase
MAAEVTPYVGVLYAGLMLTDGGPKVLEFNCRFGDPETQAILPLLDGDLVEVMLACVDGRLDEVAVGWRPGACATVVMASEGYPDAYPAGRPIAGLAEAEALDGVVVFHAGSTRQGDRIVTSGGRVLAVSGLGPDLPAAVERAYAAVGRVRFKGAHYRKDIGANHEA